MSAKAVALDPIHCYYSISRVRKGRGGLEVWESPDVSAPQLATALSAVGMAQTSEKLQSTIASYSSKFPDTAASKVNSNPLIQGSFCCIFH
jgi:hypothetical protein